MSNYTVHIVDGVASEEVANLLKGFLLADVEVQDGEDISILYFGTTKDEKHHQFQGVFTEELKQFGDGSKEKVKSDSELILNIEQMSEKEVQNDEDYITFDNVGEMTPFFEFHARKMNLLNMAEKARSFEDLTEDIFPALHNPLKTAGDQIPSLKTMHENPDEWVTWALDVTQDE